MITLGSLQERAGDERELMRAWHIAHTRPLQISEGDKRIVTTIRSSDRKENYEVWISASEWWCDCVAFSRSRERAFCKHLGALALVHIAGGSAEALPGLRELVPRLVDRIARLSLTERETVLLNAAANHKDIYETIMDGASDE